MSWSASFDMVDGNVVDVTAKENNVEPTYHNDQYVVALETVWSLVDSGVLGDPKGSFKVNISGHGNENHKPADGWANDFVSIQVVQT